MANLLNDPLMKRVIFKGLEFASPGVHAEAVFICGKRSHRREITMISRHQTPGDFSAQGKQDVNTPYCFNFYLGAAIQ